MKNFGKDKALFLKIISDNYCFEKILIDGKMRYANCDNSECNVSVKATDKDIDIYVIPKYFKKLKAIKMLLFLIENLVTGGSGKSKYEIKKEMSGFHIYGKINDVNDIIYIYENKCSGLNFERYISKRLNTLYIIFNLIPSIIMIFIVIAFLIWAFIIIL